MESSGVKELSEADLWRMYRDPASVEALIPLSIVLIDLREADYDLQDPDKRALRFSEAIANELERRDGLGVGLSYIFEGACLPIDGAFYRARLKNFVGEETFVRNVFVDNMIVPLDRLAALEELGRLPLPIALKRNYKALKEAAGVKAGATKLKLDPAQAKATDEKKDLAQEEYALLHPADNAASSLRIIEMDEAVRLLSTLDTSVTYQIHGKQQSLTQHNVGPFLRERGFQIGINKAQRALSQVKKTPVGRPRKCHDEK